VLIEKPHLFCFLFFFLLGQGIQYALVDQGRKIGVGVHLFGFFFLFLLEDLKKKLGGRKLVSHGGPVEGVNQK